MSVTPEVKQALIKKYQTSEQDTWSPEVQIAILSTRIINLTDHFKTHEKDHSSRRGLIRLVNQRRRLLGFLKKRNQTSYHTVIQELGIRG